MGKFFTFFVFFWFGVGLLGGVLQGGSGVVSTTLTANINATDDSIPVTKTTGFTGTGIIIIGDEKIGYSDTDATHFEDTFLDPIVRGAEGTTAAAHASGSAVYCMHTSVLNQSMNYSIATIADSSGMWAAVSVGLALFRMIGTFGSINFSFLGTDLAIIGYVWIVIYLGLIVTLGLALAGARRVA